MISKEKIIVKIYLNIIVRNIVNWIFIQLSLIYLKSINNK